MREAVVLIAVVDLLHSYAQSLNSIPCRADCNVGRRTGATIEIHESYFKPPWNLVWALSSSAHSEAKHWLTMFLLQPSES